MTPFVPVLRELDRLVLYNSLCFPLFGQVWAAVEALPSTWSRKGQIRNYQSNAELSQVYRPQIPRASGTGLRRHPVYHKR